MSSYSEVQCHDWQDRDFIEIITRNIKKISDFLNHFDSSTRSKLAELSEKVTQLERQMEFLEATIDSAVEHAANQAAVTSQSSDLRAPPPAQMQAAVHNADAH